MNVRFAQVFWNHPVILRAGNEGVGVFVRLLLYAAEYNMLDARIEAPPLVMTAAEKRRVIASLVRAGLLTMDGDVFVLQGRDVLWSFHNADEPSEADRARLMALVSKRDGARCVYCGVVEGLTLDHVLPRSRGGSNKLENLALACGPCNSRKGDRTPEEWRSGEVRRRRLR